MWLFDKMMLKILDGKSITVAFLEIYIFLYFENSSYFFKRILQSILK